MNQEHLSHYIRLTIFVSILFFGMNYLNAAWSDPTGTPPTNNAEVPINVGSTLQNKSGVLQANIVVSSLNSAINTVPESVLKLKIGSENGRSYIGLENTDSGNKMWQLYPQGNDLILFENHQAFGGGGIDRLTFKAKASADTTGTNAQTIYTGRLNSSRGVAENANVANQYYDLGVSTIAASKSIYSYGKICTGNSLGGCDGTGGVVIDGFATAADRPAIKANGPIQVSHNSNVTCNDGSNIGAIRYVDGNPGQLAVCKRTGASTYAWTPIQDAQSSGGSGTTVYQCPLIADWCYGRYREWPQGCSGEISLSSTCYAGDCGAGGQVACTPVGRLSGL